MNVHDILNTMLRPVTCLLAVSGAILVGADFPATATEVTHRGETVLTEARSQSAVNKPRKGMNRAVNRLVNKARKTGVMCGGVVRPPAPPLKLKRPLRKAAKRHATDMKTRNYFSHVTPEGVTFDERITQMKYRGFPSGETIASGQQTPASVVSSWLQSPDHCNILMDRYNTEVGYGKATHQPDTTTTPTTWWVADFGHG